MDSNNSGMLRATCISEGKRTSLVSCRDGGRRRENTSEDDRSPYDDDDRSRSARVCGCGCGRGEGGRSRFDLQLSRELQPPLYRGPRKSRKRKMSLRKRCEELREIRQFPNNLIFLLRRRKIHQDIPQELSTRPPFTAIPTRYTPSPSKKRTQNRPYLSIEPKKGNRTCSHPRLMTPVVPGSPLPRFQLPPGS